MVNPLSGMWDWILLIFLCAVLATTAFHMLVGIFIILMTSLVITFICLVVAGLVLSICVLIVSFPVPEAYMWTGLLLGEYVLIYT